MSPIPGRLWGFAHLLRGIATLTVVLSIVGCGSGSREPGAVMRMLERVKARGKLEKGWLRIISFRQSQVTDNDLRLIHGLAYLKSLDLTATETTDAGLAHLRSLPSLRELGLARTRITDRGLSVLERFPNLKHVDLTGTAISDVGLQTLHAMAQLEEIRLDSTRVTAEGVAALQAALPKCQVISDRTGGRAPPTAPDAPIAALPAADSAAGNALVTFKTIRPPEVIPARITAEDLASNVGFEWSTPLGPGGLVLSRLHDWSGPAHVAGSTFRRLVGLLRADDGELIFLGVDEPGWPVVSAEDLMDGLGVAVASLAGGQAPGVTFEPLEKSLSQPRDRDPLDVRYFGVAETTAVGRASYEADRLMKCLSAGRDNLTGAPLTSLVPGWKSELELLLDKPSGKSGAWHRFWIEPVGGQVRRRAESAIVRAELQLAIQTRYQVIRNGKLVDAPQAADPAAQAFARHLTDNYRRFAAEWPAFAETYNFAVLCSLAEVLLTDPAAWQPSTRDSLDHAPRLVDTPRSTPSILVSTERTTGNRIQTVQIAGGVTLKPIAATVDSGKPLQELRDRVLSARPAGTEPAVWSVESGAERLVASSARSRRRRQVWQTDCRTGTLELTRVLVRDPATEVDQWVVRVPELRVRPAATGDPPQVSIATHDGHWLALAPATIELPVSPGRTPGGISRDKSHLVAQYTNRWVQVDEPVRFTAPVGQPLHPVPDGEGRYREFDSTPPYRIQSELSSAGLTRYEWKDDRLEAIRRGDQEIRLRYDSRGRLREAVTDRGDAVEYTYARGGELRDVRHKESPGVRYDYDSLGRLSRIELPPDTATSPRPTRQLGVVVRAAPDRAAQQERRVAAAGISVLSLRETSSGGLQLVLNGDRTLDSVEPDDEGELPREPELARQFAEVIQRNSVAFPADQPIVIAGPLLERGYLADALRRILPGRTIVVTADLERAQANLAVGGVSGGGTRQESVTSGLTNEVAAQLAGLPPGSDAAGLVVVSGHNEGAGGGIDQRLGALIDEDQLAGRFVVVNSCFKANLGPRIDNVIAEGGAVAVVGFLQPIDQRLLPRIVEELQRLSAGSNSLTIPEFSNLFQQVIDNVISQGVSNPADTAKLRTWYLQTQRDPNSHGNRQRRRAAWPSGSV